MAGNSGLAVRRFLILRSVEPFGSMVLQLTSVIFPGLGPYMVEREDRAGFGRHIDVRECASRNRKLHVRRVWRPSGISEREVGKDCTWSDNRFGYRPCRRYRGGKDSFRLESSCDQPN